MVYLKQEIINNKFNVQHRNTYQSYTFRFYFGMHLISLWKVRKQFLLRSYSAY